MTLRDRLTELDRRVLGVPDAAATSGRSQPRALAFVAWLSLVVATLLVAGAAGRTRDGVLFVAWVLLAPASAVTFTHWRRG